MYSMLLTTGIFLKKEALEANAIKKKGSVPDSSDQSERSDDGVTVISTSLEKRGLHVG